MGEYEGEAAQQRGLLRLRRLADIAVDLSSRRLLHGAEEVQVLLAHVAVKRLQRVDRVPHPS